MEKIPRYLEVHRAQRPEGEWMVAPGIWAPGGHEGLKVLHEVGQQDPESLVEGRAGDGKQGAGPQKLGVELKPRRGKDLFLLGGVCHHSAL